MADEDDAAAALDSVLEALANPHRREIVYALGLQPCAISQLARMRGLSLPAIHKHVKILENAGLVSRRKTGRTTYLILNPRASGCSRTGQASSTPTGAATRHLSRTTTGTSAVTRSTGSRQRRQEPE